MCPSNSSYLSNAAMFHFHEYINLLSQNKIIKICHNLGLRPVVATAARENPKTLGSAAVLKMSLDVVIQLLWNSP